MKKINSKTILTFVLVLVLVLSLVLVACNKKTTPTNNSNKGSQGGGSSQGGSGGQGGGQGIDPTDISILDPGDGTPQHNKAIIYVTALFGGGLYNEETQETVWDPFNTEFDLYEHWAPNTPSIYDLGGVMAEFEAEKDVFPDIASALTFNKGTLLYEMSLDQDGNGINPHVVPANNKPVDKDGYRINCYYGAVAIYKQFILNTRKEFGDEYDCIMFNQDWRKSPADSAKVLEDFIAEKGYEKVIFMSHSMGGPVVNSYLARSEANREKVEMYLAYAPATLGSFDAYGAMTCPKAYLGNFLKTFGFDLNQMLADGGVVGGMVQSFLDNIDKFFNNNWGMMALCPSYEFINSYQLAGDSQGGLRVDGKKIGLCEDPDDPDAVEAAKHELYDFYNTLNWAIYTEEYTVIEGVGANEREVTKTRPVHYEEGATFAGDSVNPAGGTLRIKSGMDVKKGVVEVENFDDAEATLVDCDLVCVEKGGKLYVLLDVNGNPYSVNKRGDRIKYGAARLKTYYEGLFVDGQIAMSYVNYYMFLGTNIQTTITGISMTSGEVDEYGYPTYTCEVINNDRARVGREGYIGGDGMVCTYASLAGMDWDEMEAAGRLYEYKNYWHADVGGAWPLLGDDVLALLDDLINAKK